MKSVFTTLVVLSFTGCVMHTTHEQGAIDELVAPSPSTTATMSRPAPTPALVPATISAQCLGDVSPPANLAHAFEPANDPALLAAALGEPEAGGLCQGAVYRVKANTSVQLYRAWNSTNPGSQFGKWWAAEMPAGKVADYRTDYEICYQWSPIDKLTECQLSAGAVVVIGTGQSAQCSQYLTYPVSASKQIYIQDARSVTSNCISGDDTFNWQ